jgi:hypothetical protein
MSLSPTHDIEAAPAKEAQSPARPAPGSSWLGSPRLGSPRLDSEYRVPSTTKLGYLATYFLCNVSLTLYNKAVLGKVRACGFPSRLILLFGRCPVLGSRCEGVDAIMLTEGGSLRIRGC